ncbi:hypothetical protein [Thermomonas paludicola]|uniref:hypothetical protein n=1 Tax=Thermomonas paludicola TaxID=2884874 RepID=UPI0021155CC7|nr:hypothetical protein [Thermomonas paludicola]
MGKVIYLHGADRRCADCGSTKAVCGVVARTIVASIFIPTATCGHCGDEVETAIEGDATNIQDACDDCGQPDEDGLVSGTVHLPYGLGRCQVSLCGPCLERRDSIALGLSPTELDA